MGEDDDVVVGSDAAPALPKVEVAPIEARSAPGAARIAVSTSASPVASLDIFSGVLSSVSPGVPTEDAASTTTGSKTSVTLSHLTPPQTPASVRPAENCTPHISSARARPHLELMPPAPRSLSNSSLNLRAASLPKMIYGPKPSGDRGR